MVFRLIFKYRETDLSSSIYRNDYINQTDAESDRDFILINGFWYENDVLVGPPVSASIASGSF